MKIKEKISITKIRKRDGRVVPFDIEKITFAIFKALRATGIPNREEAEKLSTEVVTRLVYQKINNIPSVEQVQDIVELVLFESGFFKTVKAYILYRKQHGKLMI